LTCSERLLDDLGSYIQPTSLRNHIPEVTRSHAVVLVCGDTLNQFQEAVCRQIANFDELTYPMVGN
jgi:hypothetical protein